MTAEETNKFNDIINNYFYENNIRNISINNCRKVYSEYSNMPINDFIKLTNDIRDNKENNGFTRLCASLIEEYVKYLGFKYIENEEKMQEKINIIKFIIIKIEQLT